MTVYRSMEQPAATMTGEARVSKDDQQDVIAFLSDPGSYGEGLAGVERMSTHASLIFLAGDHAFKLKRSVKYPYLDFSTPELRHRACEAELALNRRTAPNLYLAIRSINRMPDGCLAFGGSGPTLDWIVVMRRFDQSGLLDRVAADNALTAPLMTQLADGIAAFHAGAERTPEHGGSAGIADVAALNETGLARFTPAVFEPGRVGALSSATRAALPALTKLLERRRLAGSVRHCHGDLHLGNICLIDGRPTLFDCLEFNRSLACIDVLYDLAFLLMDLEHRRRRDFANLVFNRYLDRADEADGIAALPLFASLRAAVRAHVKATAADAQPDAATRLAELAHARSYLDLAGDLLRRAPPRLIAVGGLSGTGKSTLAASLAPTVGSFPGARVVRSDVIRKRLLDVPLEERCPDIGYTPAVTATVYGRMRQQAADALAAGRSVILDAVAASPEERAAFAETAAGIGVPFAGLWLEAPPALLGARIRMRRNDVSDATEDVLRQQLDWDIGRLDWIRISARGDPAACAADASRALDA
jgi:aminoglycoside phosphotransferase family enzyme/predicted kinase